MVYVHAKPQAALMLDAQRVFLMKLPIQDIPTAEQFANAPGDMRRAQELLTLTTAANDEPAEPAQA